MYVINIILNLIKLGNFIKSGTLQNWGAIMKKCFYLWRKVDLWRTNHGPITLQIVEGHDSHSRSKRLVLFGIKQMTAQHSYQSIVSPNLASKQ